MTPYKVLSAAALFLVGAVFTGIGSPPVSGAAAQAKKGAGAAPKHNAFKVQVRHPGWKKTATTSAAAAKLLAMNLRRAGWNAQVREPRPGVYVVRAKMARWQNRAIVTNRALAMQLANVGRAQGFQARVVPFHR
jgi:hypothetical protein